MKDRFNREATWQALVDCYFVQIDAAKLLKITANAMYDRCDKMRDEGYDIPKKATTRQSIANAMPTEEEIAERAAQIRAQWDAEEPARRAQWAATRPVEITEVGDGWMPPPGFGDYA